MKQHYTLDEIHRYAAEIRATELEFKEATRRGEADVMKQLKDQLHVMREVIQRMHESLHKNGPLRLGLLARWLAAREIRKAAKLFPPLQISRMNESLKFNANKHGSARPGKEGI